MKQTVILFLTLASVLSSQAGQLSFMTADGKTSPANNSKIESTWTTVSIENGISEIGVAITDDRGRTCGIGQQTMPGVDLANLAINIMKENVTVVCKTDKLVFPKDGEGATVNTVWIAVK